MRLQEGEWVETTGGNDKGKVGVIVSTYDEPGIGGLYDVAFRDEKGRPDGQASGVAEKWMKGIPRPIFNSAVCSTNTVVANALAARNGRVEDKVRVTMACFDFSGLRKVTKVMTLAALKQLFAQTKVNTPYQSFMAQLEKNGATDTAVDPEITLEAEWASRA